MCFSIWNTGWVTTSIQWVKEVTNVRGEMLQHLQLVWVPFVSLKNEHDTAFSNFPFGREMYGLFCRSPSTSIHVSPSVAIFAVPIRLYRWKTFPFNFLEKYFLCVIGSARYIRCVTGRLVSVLDNRITFIRCSFVSSISFQSFHFPENGKEISHPFNHLYGDYCIILYLLVLSVALEFNPV